MARMKTPPELVRVKLALAERLVSLRRDIFGTRGGPAIARYLNISARSWYNYENGVTVPGEILLKVIEVFAVEPLWLLSGEGSRFRNGQIDQHETEASTTRTTSTETALNLLRLALRMLEDSEAARLKLDGRQWGHSSVGGEPNAGPSPAPASPIIQ